MTFRVADPRGSALHLCPWHSLLLLIQGLSEVEASPVGENHALMMGISHAASTKHPCEHCQAEDAEHAGEAMPVN